MLKCPSCGTGSVGESNFCAKCGYALQGATGQLDADSLLEDRYIITGLLGRGGMGAVYKALDLRLNKSVVAIKEMSTAALGPGKLEKALEIFKQEASMLIKLRHPSLPRVTDFFSAGEDRWYLVMDCIEGETLEALAGSQGKIPEKEVIGWALQLCDVLDYLHGRDPPVIFRDLKPANIMLTLKHEIKLIDFGIARHFNPDTSADTMSFASIGFAPPEQFGEGQTDPRSDIFSLGATLHYLVTGLDPAKNPFKYDRPDRIAPLSNAFSDLIMEMLELEPGNRPQGVAHIKKKLQGIPQGDSAAPPTELIEPGPVKGPPGAATELFLTGAGTAEPAEQDPAEGQALLQSAGAAEKKAFGHRVKGARARHHEAIKQTRQEHYFDGSPLILAAHVLVKDNLTGGVSVQCKFQNLGKERVEAVYIAISCVGVDREAVESIDEYVYLDLAAKPGLTFGDDQLIPLPDRTTRYYTITLQKVVFADGVVWKNAGAKGFMPPPEPQPLSNLGPLEEQYRRVAPSELQANLPQKYALSWRCGCGQLNLKEVSSCVKCGHDLESQLLA
ncbi:MAG: protein kinase, partial [Firmicutes bacterium]|nr:protein kinase [Bacillota bacterium]